MNSRAGRVAAEDDLVVAPGRRSRSTPCRGRTGRRRSTAPGRRRRPGRASRVAAAGPLVAGRSPSARRGSGRRAAGGTRWRRRRRRRCPGRWCAGARRRRPRCRPPARPPRPARPRGATPTPTTTSVGGRRVPSVEADAPTRPVALDRRDLGRRSSAGHAVVAVQVGEDLRRPRRRAPAAAAARRLDHGDLAPGCAGGGRDLGADPAARRSRRRRRRVVQRGRQRVGSRPSVRRYVHAVEVGAGDREPARRGAGRQQQLVVAQPLAAVERDRARRPGRCARPRCAGAQLDVVLGVPARRRGRRPSRARPRPAGSPWTAAAARRGVRAPRRCSTTRPVEALVAQGLGRLGTGEAGADDDERCGVRAWLVLDRLRRRPNGRRRGWVPGRLCSRARRSRAYHRRVVME